MITKEMLEKRKLSLLMDYNALHGALQDIDYWLKVLEEGEQSPSSELEWSDGTD